MNAHKPKQRASDVGGDVGLSIGIAFDAGEGFAVRLTEAGEGGAVVGCFAAKTDAALRAAREEGAG
ncbi:MAG: hypothetical protein JWR26_4809 [Pedosphaera sp.]|nr:hypothetical protein [Pedosphaera sp.]